MLFSVLITSSINPHYSASIYEGLSEIQGKMTYIDKHKIALHIGFLGTLSIVKPSSVRIGLGS